MSSDEKNICVIQKYNSRTRQIPQREQERNQLLDYSMTNSFKTIETYKIVCRLWATGRAKLMLAGVLSTDKLWGPL